MLLYYDQFTQKYKPSGGSDLSTLIYIASDLLVSIRSFR